PAWVSWASAPGYVSWCPLGYDGRPVISVIDLSYRPGWTIIPSRSFAPRVFVTRNVIEGRSLPASVRGSLAARTSAPVSYEASRSLARRGGRAGIGRSVARERDAAELSAAPHTATDRSPLWPAASPTEPPAGRSSARGAPARAVVARG